MSVDESHENHRGEPSEVDGATAFAGRDGALATEVLTASLSPDELPAGGWDRLRSAATASRTAGTTASGGLPRPARAVAGDADLPPYVAPPPPRRTYGFLVALTIAALALGGVGVWGYQRGAEAARLRDDQRILAYWMSNPDMRLTPLQPAGDVQAGRLGVLCALPDGRALVLQPNPAEPGTTYVVVGWGDGGLRELARGRTNMLQFDVGGIDVVELRAERGQESWTLALAHLD